MFAIQIYVRIAKVGLHAPPGRAWSHKHRQVAGERLIEAKVTPVTLPQMVFVIFLYHPPLHQNSGGESMAVKKKAPAKKGMAKKGGCGCC
jgi:hypothetical protein